MGIILLIFFLYCVCINIFIPDDPKETYRKNYLLEQERKKELINWAYQNNEKLEITYKKFNGETTKRIIQPLSTVYKDKLGEFTEEYIQAYCYLRHEERTFRFDRIKQIEMSNEE